MLRLAWLALLACAAALAVAPAAGALVQIDRGIAGVRLNNSKAEVRTALGAPDRIVRGRNDFSEFIEFRYHGGIRVVFQGRRRASAVSTSGHGDRTARGVGVGSTEATVRRKVPGVRCETIAGFRSCHSNDFTAGQRVTDFQIRLGRVVRVTVGFVLD